LIPIFLSLAVVVLVSPHGQQYSGREGALNVRPPRIEPSSISVDGRLDEREWNEAAVLSDFTQYTPIEGEPASQETEVRVFYSADAIYFGVHAFDKEPDQILAHLMERDAAQGDDWIRILLDTFNDERQAYTFFVTPFGVQSDGMWLESIQPRSGVTGPKIDFNPDFIFESSGTIVEDGWVAEVRIPYLSLRFPETEEQDWGLQVARGVMRDNFKSSWSPLTVEESSTLAQSGHLEGLYGLRPKRLIEFNPVTTGKVEGFRVNDVFSRGDLEPEIGVNARLGITQNLVLDATVNPDFSQVEADVDQIQVNERFALFFPEKRPFFLEGAEIFRTNQNLVHTRRIVDPIAGTKLTGKAGAFSVGYLGALDHGPSSVFGGTDDAVFNLIRARADVGTGSTVGLLYADRTLTETGGFNRVATADSRLLFGGRYSLATQVTASWTSDGTPGASAPAEPAITLGFLRSGVNFSYRARLADQSPGFRTETGFMPRLGDTDFGAAVGFKQYGSPGATVETWGLELQNNNFSSHEDFWAGRAPYEYELELHPNVSIRGSRRANGILKWGGFRFRPADFESHEVVGAGGAPGPYPIPPELKNILGIAVTPNLRLNDVFSLSGWIMFREIPLFVEGSRGWEQRLAPALRIQPGEQLRIEASHTWARLERSDDGSHFSTAHIPRLRVQYQFSRSLLVRVIGQFDLEKRVALRHPVTGQAVLINGVLQSATERGNFSGQALVSYEPSPGTILFIGYSRVMDGPYGYPLHEKDLRQDGLFVKLSYLFRM